VDRRGTRRLSQAAIDCARYAESRGKRLEVEDVAGRPCEYFRRIFYAREGFLELHLSILHGVAARYRTPFFSALKQYSHRPTGVFHALPISQGKSIINSH
jgi:arginine decarboxylase